MNRRDFLRLSIGTGALALFYTSGITGCSGNSTPEQAKLLLPPLPFKEGDLAPYISEQTLKFHYGKHHEGYVTKLAGLIKGTVYENLPIIDIVQKSAGSTEDKAIFNNAAQSFNHSFYWQSMRPGGGGEPRGELLKKIEGSFKSYKGFREAFAKAANGQFGSGWAWLIQDSEGKLSMVATSNADTPITQGLRPLLTIDVWEHAYYLDYQNRRADYVEAFLEHLINWEFAAGNLA